LAKNASGQHEANWANRRRRLFDERHVRRRIRRLLGVQNAPNPLGIFRISLSVIGRPARTVESILLQFSVKAKSFS
jgi:hypothetical protein